MWIGQPTFRTRTVATCMASTTTCLQHESASGYRATCRTGCATQTPHIASTRPGGTTPLAECGRANVHAPAACANAARLCIRACDVLSGLTTSSEARIGRGGRQRKSGGRNAHSHTASPTVHHAPRCVFYGGLAMGMGQSARAERRLAELGVPLAGCAPAAIKPCVLACGWAQLARWPLMRTPVAMTQHRHARSCLAASRNGSRTAAARPRPFYCGARARVPFASASTDRRNAEAMRQEDECVCAPGIPTRSSVFARCYDIIRGYHAPQWSAAQPRRVHRESPHRIRPGCGNARLCLQVAASRQVSAPGVE